MRVCMRALVCAYACVYACVRLHVPKYVDKKAHEVSTLHKELQATEACRVGEIVFPSDEHTNCLSNTKWSAFYFPEMWWLSRANSSPRAALPEEYLWELGCMPRATDGGNGSLVGTAGSEPGGSSLSGFKTADLIRSEKPVYWAHRRDDLPPSPGLRCHLPPSCDFLQTLAWDMLLWCFNAELSIIERLGLWVSGYGSSRKPA